MSLRYILCLICLWECLYAFEHYLHLFNKNTQKDFAGCTAKSTKAVTCPNFYIKRLFFMSLILLVHRKLFQHRQLYSFIIQAIKLLLHLGVRCLADLNVRMVRSIML